jgi:putative ABC transport system permease protein
MRWANIRRVFRLPNTKQRMRQALDDELRFHVEGRIEELMERLHLSRDEAEREARRRFGDVDAYRREASNIDDTILQRRSTMELTDAIARETRHAVRTLLRAPAFTAISIITLGLGLGAATTIFTLLDRVALAPLPYPNADRLLHIGTLWPMVKKGTEYAISRGQFFNFKQNSRAIDDIGLYDAFILAVPGDGGAHPPERVPTLSTSSSLFPILGVRPEMGRLYTPEEGAVKQPNVAVITHEYWMRRFGGDPHILGKRIIITTDHAIEIVGVLAPGAAVPELRADIWMPNELNPSDPPQNNHTHKAIALVKSGITLAAADADLKRVERQFEAGNPRVYSPKFIQNGFAINTKWLHDQVVGETISRTLWILFAGVAFVLLISAANVANLFLVRIDGRRREAAVRTALGADRSHLAVHYMTESMLLAGVAAVVAVAISLALLHAVVAMAPTNLPRLDEVRLGWRSVAFCAGTALAIGVLFGAVPSLSTGLDVSLLREGGRGLTTSRVRNAVRRVLVVSQVALAMVLLTGAALMVKSYDRLRRVKPGFDPIGVQSMTIALPYSRYQTYTQASAFWHELSRRVNALPGVQASGAIDGLPLTGDPGCTAVIIDASQGTDKRVGCVPTIVTAPGYFETMRMHVDGAPPDWASTEAGVGPVVVSRAFANEFWPNENPVGHGIKINSNVFPWFRIVGVAEDVRATGLQNPPISAVYFPVTPATGSPNWNSANNMSFVVRTSAADPTGVVAAVRKAVADLDPQVPIADVQSMEVVVTKSMAQTSFSMLLLLISATIALVLSAVGIYGVISYVVGQRRSEIGIRMALGAEVARIGRMVVGQSVGLVLIGVGIGAVGAMLGTRLLQSLLFDVSPTDPWVFAGTVLIIVAVAVTASLVPARRAARIDPLEAMRR